MKKQFQKITILLVLVLALIPNIIANAKTAMTIDKKTYIYTDSRKEAKFHTNKGYAYCITPHRTGPAQGTSLSYKGKETNGGLLYLLENAGTSDSEYLVTQLAMWKYDSNYLPDFYINHSGYEVVKKAKSLAADAAKNKNYKGHQPSVSIVISSTKLTISNDKKTYRTGIIKVNTAYAGNAKLTLENAPANTKIVDKNGNVVSTVKNSGTVYVIIPAESVTKSVSFTLKATTTGKVSTVERYTTGNSKWQDLVVLVREDKTVTDSKKLSVEPIGRVCEIFNGKYYGKDGKETDKTNYSIQCEKHTCEVIGDHYFGKDGKETDKTNYSIQCEKHTCEKIGDHYFGKDGKETDKTNYSIQCEKHTCEVVGDHYFGKDGKETDKTNYTIQCEKHSCEKIGNKIFGKNGNEVTEEQFNLECNKHVCEKIGNHYFGKNGYEVEEVTYQKECFKHTCEKVGNTYYGPEGTEVDQQEYEKKCFNHTCQEIDGTYYGADGNEIPYADYVIQCEKHTCEFINGKYFGQNGTEITEDEFINQCIHTCEIYDNQYYGQNGTVVTEEEYKSQCETVVVPVPDTATGPFGDLFSIIMGSAALGTVGGIISHERSKRRA